MDNTQDNMNNQPDKVDLRQWMQEHPREYGEFARDMGEGDLLSVFFMGQAAFLASPEFQKRLEDMIDLDELDVDELVNILNESGFAKKVFTNPGKDEDWEKYRLPFAAWLKHGRSSEVIIESVEEAITLTENQQARWELSKFLKDVMSRLVGTKQRSREELCEYLNYRKDLVSGNIAEWALNSVDDTEERTDSPIKPSRTTEGYMENLTDLVASHNQDMVNRIGDWLKYNGRGIDLARLYVALVESDEIKANLTVTRFAASLKISFPEVKIVGTRQTQKAVNTLQNVLPHGKRYGKDEPENRFAIDKIKTEVLPKNHENID